MRKKTFFSTSMRVVVWSAAVLIVAGIVHLTSILALPRLATDNAYARLSARAPVNQFVLLPEGDIPLPFEDPATAIGVCRFDLARGPVRLRGQLGPETLALLSFHTRFGQNFYAMSDRGALRGRLDIVVATSEQIEDLESNDAEDEPPQDLRLASPTLQGFMLVRGLAERPSLMGEIRRTLSALACEG